MPRLRILALIVNLVPYHVARWSAVAAAGHRVTLLQRRVGDPFAVLGTAADQAPFQVHTLSDPADGSEPWEIQLIRWIDRIEPHVLVISGYAFAESLAALLAAARRRIPVVLCSESNRHDAPRQPWSEALKRRIVQRTQAGLVGGEQQAAYLQDLGLPAQAIFRGYNAVDNRHFSRGRHWRRAADQARRQFGLPCRYLLAVSRFTRKKNLSGLIEGFALWRRQAPSDHQNLQLLILGDGPLRSALEQQVAALGLQATVHLPGACSYANLPLHYALAEAFIHASTVEQWGLVVNEAMAASLPVLVSHTCGCVAELVQPGVTGLRFDPHSTSAIAGAIHWLMAQSAHSRQRLAVASRRRVAAYGPEAFAAGLETAARHAMQQRLACLSRLDRTLLQRLMTRTVTEP